MFEKDPEVRVGFGRLDIDNEQDSSGNIHSIIDNLVSDSYPDYSPLTNSRPFINHLNE